MVSFLPIDYNRLLKRERGGHEGTNKLSSLGRGEKATDSVSKGSKAWGGEDIDLAQILGLQSQGSPAQREASVSMLRKPSRHVEGHSGGLTRSALRQVECPRVRLPPHAHTALVGTFVFCPGAAAGEAALALAGGGLASEQEPRLCCPPAPSCGLECACSPLGLCCRSCLLPTPDLKGGKATEGPTFHSAPPCLSGGPYVLGVALPHRP